MITALSSYKRTVDPGMPFTLAEARMQLKNEEVNYDDSLVESLVKAAGQIAENKTNRAFMQSTWVLSTTDWLETDRFGYFPLYPGPLVSVESITYWPSSGAQVTMAANTDYQVDTSSVPGRVKMLNTPAVADRPDAIQVTFIAGYGAADDDESAQQAALPADAVSWMKLQLGQLYKFRELHIQGQPLYSINTFADGLIYPYIL